MFALCRLFLFTLVIGISKPKLSEPENIHTLPQAPNSDDGTLILTHVLFRHGNRTADGHVELYPNDPYLTEKYYPYGNGQLTKAGKQKEFSIGKALRNRYNTFLGEDYYTEIIEAVSTDYTRTKMSLQLVLAGLFPPRKEDAFESDINWQPVPFNYLPKHQDKILLGVLCPRYLEMYDELSKASEMVDEFSKYQMEFNYISEHTGLNITSFYDVYNLYFGLSTEEEWGFKLPEWTKSVWPDTIIDLAVKEYFVSMNTPDMRRMATGYFLQKIVEDTKNKIISSNDPGTKMYLYSAHESNVAELLISLDVFKPHIPTYGSYVILEVHRINGIYGIKIFYQNYTSDEIQLLTIPSCDSFCPLDKFISIVKENFPEDDLCGI